MYLANEGIAVGVMESLTEVQFIEGITDGSIIASLHGTKKIFL